MTSTTATRRPRTGGPRTLHGPRLVLALMLSTGLVLVAGCTQPGGETTPTSHRDFMFQINGYHTRNQGGQSIDMYFYYRYDPGLSDADLPNYIRLRDDAIHYMDIVDVRANPYWETLNAQLCHQLKTTYPLEAISCQMQVKGDLSSGVRYEPGYHSSVETIGDIPPLQIPGPRPTPTAP